MWNISLKSSLFKEGDSADCYNYRGIRLCSSPGNLFISLYNQRVCNYLDSKGYVSEFHAGLRPDYLTADNIFAIKIIINKYIFHLKKSFYFCFIDFSKPLILSMGNIFSACC